MADQRPLSLQRVRELGQRDQHLDADPTYARVVMRRISPLASYAVVNFSPLSADSITLLSIAAGVAGGLLTAVPGMWTNLLAVALLQLAYLLDVADGEVARIRRSAGKRGAYLDLIGHVLQNRALYGGAGFALIMVSDYAWWAIATAMLGVAFASPFGEHARQQIVGAVAPLDVHGTKASRGDLVPKSVRGRIYWAYRRVSFIWNYPASMNLFCLALLADAARFGSSLGTSALIVPVVAGIFALTLATKQLANAVRLLRWSPWE